MSCNLFRIPLATTLLLALAAAAGAQCELQKLLPSDGDPRDHFGAAVALQGDTAMVGAISDTGFGVEPGVVYVFGRAPAGWTERQILRAPTPVDNDNFGGAIALDGDLAVVGARGVNAGGGTASGAAFVLERSGSTWSVIQQLTASNATFFSFFGLSVDLSGERIVVGALGASVGGVQQGAAYVFERVGGVWTETALLTASDGAHGDDFGQGVAIDGDRIVCTAPWHANAGVARGAAYVFEHDGAGWVEVEQLLPAWSGSSFLAYGDAVDMEGSVIAVGAPQAGSIGRGFVYEELGSGWELTGFLSTNSESDDRFADSISISGDRILVGTPGDDAKGSVSVFGRSGAGWVEALWMQASDAQFGDRYGHAVALDGEDAIIGALEEGTLGQYAGAAYALSVCEQVETYCDGAPNSFGSGARMSSLGTTNLAQNGFRVVAQYAPPGQAGLFFYGPSQVQAPFGDGTLCVGPGGVGTFRLSPALVINPFGRATRQVDFTELPASAGPGQIAAGSTWNFQFWYRDPAGGPAGFNLTDGLSARFCP